MEYILNTEYDSKKSFYNKALIKENGETIELYSYGLLVSYIIKDLNKVIVLGTHSQTTLRHIKEFLLQNGFKAETKKQIEQDYLNEELKK